MIASLSLLVFYLVFCVVVVYLSACISNTAETVKRIEEKLKSL